MYEDETRIKYLSQPTFPLGNKATSEQVIAPCPVEEDDNAFDPDKYPVALIVTVAFFLGCALILACVMVEVAK